VFAEDEALRRGHREIRLYTHQTMVGNQRLFASIGYEETGRGGEAGYHRVFMRKQHGIDSAHRQSPVEKTIASDGHRSCVTDAGSACALSCLLGLTAGLKTGPQSAIQYKLAALVTPEVPSILACARHR
jgi:hypothetical protein